MKSKIKELTKLAKDLDEKFSKKLEEVLESFRCDLCILSHKCPKCGDDLVFQRAWPFADFDADRKVYEEVCVKCGFKPGNIEEIRDSYKDGAIGD